MILVGVYRCLEFITFVGQAKLKVKVFCAKLFGINLNFEGKLILKRKKDSGAFKKKKII